jgi:hypothetical protein
VNSSDVSVDSLCPKEVLENNSEESLVRLEKLENPSDDMDTEDSDVSR